MFDFTVSESRNTVATLNSGGVAYKVRFYCGKYNAMTFEELTNEDRLELNKMIREINEQSSNIDLLLP